MSDYLCCTYGGCFDAEESSMHMTEGHLHHVVMGLGLELSDETSTMLKLGSAWLAYAPAQNHIQETA